LDKLVKSRITTAVVLVNCSEHGQAAEKIAGDDPLEAKVFSVDHWVLWFPQRKALSRSLSMPTLTSMKMKMSSWELDRNLARVDAGSIETVVGFGVITCVDGSVKPSTLLPGDT
jgi:hypothetical protein